MGGGAEIDADDCREAVQRLRRERPMEPPRPPPERAGADAADDAVASASAYW